jgi:hypothetical protein
VSSRLNQSNSTLKFYRSSPLHWEAGTVSLISEARASFNIIHSRHPVPGVLLMPIRDASIMAPKICWTVDRCLVQAWYDGTYFALPCKSIMVHKSIHWHSSISPTVRHTMNYVEALSGRDVSSIKAAAIPRIWVTEVACISSSLAMAALLLPTICGTIQIPAAAGVSCSSGGSRWIEAFNPCVRRPKSKEAVAVLIGMLENPGRREEGWDPIWRTKKTLSDEEAYQIKEEFGLGGNQLPEVTPRKHTYATFSSPEGAMVTHIKLGDGAVKAFNNLEQLHNIDPSQTAVHIFYEKDSGRPSTDLQKGGLIAESYVYERPGWGTTAKAERER